MYPLILQRMEEELQGPKMLDINEAKSKLESLQQQRRLSWWQQRYGFSLLEKMEDFRLAGWEKEAELCMERLEQWLSRHAPAADDVGERIQSRDPFSESIRSGLLRNVENLTRLLTRKRLLIPRLERENLEAELDAFRSNMESGNPDESDISSFQRLRTRVIQRIRRSLRAQDLVPVKGRRSAFQLPESQNQIVIGPYNNRSNLLNTFRMVGEQDPIWVEDLMECYHRLMKFEEKISSAIPANRTTRKNTSK